MLWLWIPLGIALTIVFLILALPWKLALQGEWGQRKEIHMNLGWGCLRLTGKWPDAAGTVRISLAFFAWQLFEKSLKSRGTVHKAKEKRVPGSKTGGSSQQFVGLFFDSRFWELGFRYLKRIIRALRLRLRLEGDYGTGDPAETGMIAGLLAVLPGKNIILNLRPDFMEMILEVQGEIRLQVIPAQLLWIGLNLAWEKPVRKLWFSGIRSRFKLKEAVPNV